MLDWEGNMQERKYRKRHIIDASKSRPMSECYYEEQIDMSTAGTFTTKVSDSFHSMLHNDDEAFSKWLTDRLDSSKFIISVGSINTYVE